VGDAIVANAQSQGRINPAKEETNLPTDKTIVSAWCQYRRIINKRALEPVGMALDLILKQ